MIEIVKGLIVPLGFGCFTGIMLIIGILTGKMIVDDINKKGDNMNKK